MLPSGLPKCLYKFYPDHNTEFVGEELNLRKSALSEPYLYCSNADDLNDPFEFQIKIAPFKTNQEVLDFYALGVQDGSLKIDLDLLRRKLDRTGSALLREKSAEINHSIYESNLANIKVCCFTKRYNSILMWSHYSTKHKGFCLKFSVEKLAIQDYVKKVDYRKANDFPVIRPIDIRINSGEWTLQQMLAVKHKGWRYEKEWRLLTSVPNFNFDVGAVEQVLLGCRADDALQNELKGYFSQSEFLKAKRSSSGFKLHFEKLS